ncbi:MAG: polysaccharide biosynthesis/export family protein [Candidatus Omnitrophica bacterium]|nr:polysaccharide biosynthesis/export family protein [Candidatus Omnitrophota bacterium]
MTIRKLRIFVLAILVAGLLAPPVGAEAVKELVDPSVPSFDALDETYLLGPGDEVDVFIYQHADLSRAVKVRRDGKISYPLAGEILADGRSLEQLGQDLSERISKTVRDPQITVMLKTMRTEQILIMGEVISPGLMTMEEEPISALMAIGKAQGWTGSAVLNSTIIVRRLHSQRPQVARLRLWDAIRHGAVENDILLQPGDIVYVPKSFIADVMDFLAQLHVSPSVTPRADFRYIRIGGSSTYNANVNVQ